MSQSKEVAIKEINPLPQPNTPLARAIAEAEKIENKRNKRLGIMQEVDKKELTELNQLKNFIQIVNYIRTDPTGQILRDVCKEFNLYKRD